jgi:hypothetical protein
VLAADGATEVYTLQSFDQVDGGNGTDTLNVTNGSGDSKTTPALTSIENVVVRSVKDDSGINLSASTGVSTVTVSNSTGKAEVSGVGAIANFAVSNQNKGVTFKDNTAASVNLSLTNVGKSSAPNTVTFDDKITSLAVTTSAAHAKLAGAATVETLSIAATGANSFDANASAGAVKTLTLTGAGSVDLTASAFTALTKIVAGDNSGGFKVQADDDLVTVTGSKGNDSLEFTAAVKATAKIDLGDGNDTLTIAAASAKGAVINGGAGANTLAVTDGDWINSDATKIYTNFQTLEIGGGGGVYDTSLISGLNAVTLSNTELANDATITNATAGTTLTINAEASTDLTTTKGLTYTLKDATGKADALTVTLNAKDGDNDATAEGVITVTKLVADGIESLTINSNVSNLDTDLAATKYTNTIAELNGDAVQTLVVKGNANLTVTATNISTATKVDASAATGKFSIDLSLNNKAVEFLGGSAADTYKGSGNGDTINAGKGGDAITLDDTFASIDTLIFKAGDSQLTSKADAFDTITKFGTVAGGGALDIIDLGAFGFTGTQKSALANKGALTNAMVDGSTLSAADWFVSGGAARGVAIGTNDGHTYVYVDVDKNGSFDASADLFIKLAGVTDVTLANFGF